MRILLVNKFYYARGGDCIVTMNLEQMLKAHGHDVAIFSMQHPANEPSEWSSYWPTEMRATDALVRPFGSPQVRRNFRRLLRDFRPNVVHLHNIHTQLSPVVAKMAHAAGIRVVWTLHDSKLVCPCYTCRRNGQECTECFTRPTAVISHRCMPGSLPGAIIGYLEARRWNPQRLQEVTDRFLPPSRFLKELCVAGGYDAGKFTVLPNCVDAAKVASPRLEKGDHYIYVGRVTAVKGLRTLCKAASRLPYRLVVVGDGDLLAELKATYAACGNIEFRGQMQWREFRPLLEGARFSVTPSEWSENNPLSVLESLCLGTPVLGADTGGIPELINEGVNGMTFPAGDADALTDAIGRMMNARFGNASIAREATQRYSSDTYYDNLMRVYRAEISDNNSNI